MNLYLVQHAEAKQKEEDPERSLSNKGWADIRKVAAFVAAHSNIKVDNIFHSGKTRTQQTAEVLAEYLNPARGVEESEGLQPLDDPSTWAERLAVIEEDIVLVGHLPHLNKLSAYLICQNPDKTVIDFQMGGVVCLGKDESGTWSIRWMVIPQILD
jgi:phosphohistidine phosphatase